MEQNLPLTAKKVWSLVRIMFYMLRKGISKRKLLLDLNMMMKRGKLAGKALHNLMFHHHHNWSTSAAANRRPSHLSSPSPPPDAADSDTDFSCTTSPAHPVLSLFSTHKKHHNKKKPKPQPADDRDEVVLNAAVMKSWEMLTSAMASPAIAGFGKSPVVRQLRITDSPFPLTTGEEDSYVDEAAEKFIMKFYNDLRRQN